MPPTSSQRPGMGAIPYSGGTTFRVWAPFAVTVAVRLCDSGEVHPLAHEVDGYWSADVPGVTPGRRYLFAVQGGDGSLFDKADPYARDMTASDGESIVVDPTFDWSGDDFSAPGWNELVMYELHLGTFNDRPGGAPGDLAGATERLAYLAEMGINAVEIMPPMEFIGGHSWGYNPSHIFSIESDYGRPDDLKRFVKAAHAHGIAVIMDVVYNHLGPDDLDLWRFDGWSAGGGGIYFYNDEWKAKTDFGHTRPDFGRREVRRFLRDNALMWLEEFRMDGLRWDSTANIRNAHGADGPYGDLPEGWSFMQWVNDEIDARQPWKISIAEDMQRNRWIVRETAAGGAGFDAQWDAGFVHPVRGALRTPVDEERSMAAIREALAGREGDDPLRRVIYTESHDEAANGRQRLTEMIDDANPESWAAKKRSTLGAALVMTAPGLPMLFQGQEFLEDKWFRDTDPLEWERLDRFGGIRLLYADLIRLRRNWWNITAGLRGRHIDVFHVNDADKVVAWRRRENGGAGDDVIVVANFSCRGFDRYRIGFPAAGVWKVRFNGDWEGYDETFGGHPAHDVWAGGGGADRAPFSGEVSVGPYTAVILSQERP